ncbi:MAG: hypothetical protein J1E65_05905 [Lachnospiraceae bacterium]|nr:hypothetical protein [Lachnospiraceae bacterium]
MRKKVGLLVGGISLTAVLILLIAGGLLYRFVFHTPLARLTKGLTKMVKELQDYENPIAEEIDLAQVMNNRKDSANIDLQLNIGLPLVNGLPTIGLDFEDSYDYDAKNMQADLWFSVYNADLLRARMTVIEDMLYLEAPHILTSAYSVNLASLGKDYNNSIWADLIGIDMDEDYSYDFFTRSAIGADADITKLKKELREVFQEDLTEIWEDIRIEESGDTKKIEGNGESVICQEIVITLDKDGVEKLGEDVSRAIYKSDYVEGILAKIAASDSYSTGSYGLRKLLTGILAEQIHLELKDDIQLCFYLDNKDRILAIETHDAIFLQNSKIDNIRFSFIFTGGERTPYHISGQILFELDGHEFSIEIEQEAEVTKYFYEKTLLVCVRMDEEEKEAEIAYISSWDIEKKEFDLELTFQIPYFEINMQAEGALSGIKKGEAFTLKLRKCNLSLDGDTHMTLSGSLQVQPFEGSITAPEGAKEFLKLSQWEIYQMAAELSEIFKWLSG